MKVLRIFHSGVVSGFRQRERELVKAGVEVRLITAKHWEEGSIPVTYEPDPDDNFPVIPCGTALTNRVPLFLYDPIPIIRELRRFQPDIVDIHEEPYSLACLEIIALIHLFSPRSRVCFYSAQNIYKRYPWPFRWFEKWAYRRASAAYPCSKGVRDVLLEKGFNKPAPVIALGVDLNGFRPHRAPELRRTLKLSGAVIGYVGRVTEAKGISDLLEAVAGLPPRSYTVLLVGDGPDRSRFARLAEELGIGDYVRWAGAVPSDHIAEYYGALDVLVVPSRTTPSWKEQFGRVIAEAMACEIAVVGSDSGSIPEVVGDGGIIVPERDPERLRDAIRTLLESPSLRASLGEAGRERSYQLYTWPACAAQLSALYQRIHGQEVS